MLLYCMTRILLPFCPSRMPHHDSAAAHLARHDMHETDAAAAILFHFLRYDADPILQACTFEPLAGPLNETLLGRFCYHPA